MITDNIQQLIQKVREQLNRNGLPSDNGSDLAFEFQPDIEAIRMTIEREEKIYPLLSTVSNVI